MDIIFLLLYSLAALINIISIQCVKRVIRIFSKICLMPILLLFYFSKSYSYSVSIILAIVLSWCGDILLIKPRKFGLYAGILSFLAAHILYVFIYIDSTPEYNIKAFIISILLILLIECFLIKKLHIPNNNRFPAIIYGIAIGLLVVFSLQYYFLYKNLSGVLFVTGSILFFISDAVLSYFNMIKIMTKNALSVVMLSYIIAQACIVIGYIKI